VLILAAGRPSTKIIVLRFQATCSCHAVHPVHTQKAMDGTLSNDGGGTHSNDALMKEETCADETVAEDKGQSAPELSMNE
jgi:hypothetical protein